MPKPLVSIITPTFGRGEFLEAIATCVKSQHYRNVEWLVLDDSEQPSGALSALPADAVRYMHIAERLSIGEKRNRLVDMARGELIAHFDDDDYYGPNYLSTMVGTLETAKADFVRLTGFFAAHLNQGQIGYYRTLVKQGAGFEFSGKGVKPVMLEDTSMPHIHLAYGWAMFTARAYGRPIRSNPLTHSRTASLFAPHRLNSR
jgi:glycosyltransferase involved in cell wall biosynthesis